MHSIISKAEKEKMDELSRLSLFYTVSDFSGHEIENADNFPVMQQVLRDAGVCIDLYDNLLVIRINGVQYRINRTRFAGRGKQYAQIDGDLCQYSDVVWMSLTMQDKQIADKIGMKIATYYRHKKKMRESDYYKSLDRNRINDREYLRSVPGDYLF